MRLTVPVLALAALIASAPAARAQESDAEIKQRILDMVRKRMEVEKKNILERMSAVIDEELSGGAPKRAPAAGGAKDQRVRDLERKLQQLDDQRDDLQRDIRGIKRETEDAKIAESAKGMADPLVEALEAQDREAAEEAFAELSKSFNAYNKNHSAKEYDKSIAGFKKLYYGLRKSTVERQTIGLWVPAAYNVGCGYALQGKTAEAIDWLEIAIKAGYEDYEHIRNDSDWDSVKKERRFLRLLADR